jgi:hypothetical protein
MVSIVGFLVSAVHFDSTKRLQTSAWRGRRRVLQLAPTLEREFHQPAVKSA